MKTKIFSAFFILFLCLAAVGAVNASADTYGDLTYEVSGNTITITGCNKSAADVVIPSKIKGRTVTSIGRGAFSDCTSLTSVKIPDSVTSIGDVAFYGCSFTSITIPGSVTSVGLNAFFDCENLERVDITDLAAWCKISFGGYLASNPLYYAHNLYLNGEVVENLVIPDSVESISDYAFAFCKNLAKVTIPDSVTSIGDSAFYDCENLAKVTIPDSVTGIGDSAFSGCTSLMRVDITDLAAWCKMSLGDNNNPPFSCEYDLYLNGELVENLVIPDGVASIGRNAFYLCTGLTSITIPDSVTSIGDSAFYGCENLERVDITDLAAWCKINYDDRYVRSNPLYYAHNLYLDGELVENLVIPDGVTCIGKYAFIDCYSIRSVTIPDSVTSIGRGAFYTCKNLNRVDITDLAAWCKIDFESTDSNPLYDAHNLYLNGELVENLVIPDGITRVNDYAFSGYSSIRSVTIPDSVTSIGASSFSGCTGLASVTIPDSLTSIGRYAFSGCSSLMGITIPDSVTSIGGSAFYGCSSLTSITIPGSVTSIGKGTFGDCSSLTGITIPGSVTSIGDSAFSGCRSLASITIPDSVTSIGDYAFSECYHLPGVTIPDSVTSIGDYAFSYCYDLTSVTIPEGLNVIPKSAFSDCSNLKAITIPASMEYIRKAAFSGCKNIKYVFFKGSRDYWDNKMVIYTGNDALNNAEIICGAKEKTYNFVTNCEKTLSPVTAYYIAGAPNTETLSRKKYVTGWYDNPVFSGVPVKFPYYSDKTTLYAKLADRTGESFESAVYVPENGSSTISAYTDNYWMFIPEKAGTYVFKSTAGTDLYLYNSNKAELASGSNSITFSLAAGEVYYIKNTYCYSSGGTLTVTQADYKGTSTSISNNGKNIRVVPTDVETGTKITVALYNGDKFVGTKVATYQGGAIEFTTNTEYTTIKVMAWNADNLTPCAKAEVVER